MTKEQIDSPTHKIIGCAMQVHNTMGNGFQEVMLEIKAIEKLMGVHKAQAINYCEAYKIGDGLLINFGGTSLEFKRVYNKKLI